MSFFEKHKWLGVVFASFLFGLLYIINGNVVQALFTFGIGLVFGFAKHKIKDCGYVGVSVGHGSYDFFEYSCANIYCLTPLLICRACEAFSLTEREKTPEGLNWRRCFY